MSGAITISMIDTLGHPDRHLGRSSGSPRCCWRDRRRGELQDHDHDLNFKSTARGIVDIIRRASSRLMCLGSVSCSLSRCPSTMVLRRRVPGSDYASERS